MRDETPAIFGLGERVAFTRKVPQYAPGPTLALPGDAGTVTLVGPILSRKLGLRAIVVRLDRTGRDVTTFEEALAPEPSKEQTA
jgi:hypothetical protein